MVTSATSRITRTMRPMVPLQFVRLTFFVVCSTSLKIVASPSELWSFDPDC